MLHSNRQLRAERYGDTEKGCHKLAVQQKTMDDELHFKQSVTYLFCTDNLSVLPGPTVG